MKDSVERSWYIIGFHLMERTWVEGVFRTGCYEKCLDITSARNGPLYAVIVAPLGSA
jgi:hypothetical protein